jgi:hypothetical protein
VCLIDALSTSGTNNPQGIRSWKYFSTAVSPLGTEIASDSLAVIAAQIVNHQGYRRRSSCARSISARSGADIELTQGSGILLYCDEAMP